ncbi:MAG TPA: aminopeptidase N, partial [Terricaulis sp.]|nr:aminopeptidase N [Terricaulis sp.]
LDVFNIVAVRDFNFGAMENKGLNVFNSSLILADAQTATDGDFEAIEAVVGHEYFHNWTGNRITCRDWFQLCLKEGLTVYREQEFSADQRSRPTQRIKDVKRLRGRQFGEDSGPLAHPVRPSSYQKIDNFYTATVYEKGGELIRMLKRLIGADAFDRGMQLYFTRRDGTASTVEDFIACFEEASGESLKHFFSWYEQAGTPHVTARGSYDAQTGAYELKLTQRTPPTPGQSGKQALPIPLSLSFIAEDGEVLSLTLDGQTRPTHDVLFDQGEATLRFTGAKKAPIPAPLRGFSAPIILDDGLGAEARLAQMAHESDAFTRWEAGQAVARALLLGQSEAKPEALAEALARELDRAQEDPAFAALALRLPDLNELLLASPAPDPEALYAKRESLRRVIAGRLRQKLKAIALQPSETPFSPSAEAAGRRSLKSAALDLLAALGEEEADTLLQAFDAADNMTAAIAALEGLSASGAAAFDAALDRFYARWRENPLVIDKWFAVQAATPRPDALQRAEALRAHADFNLRNPNRVRSLAAAFAVRNARAFHAADGGGYRFLAELAGDVDALNPALAARLLTAFESWRRYDPGRQDHARAALQSLAARKDLSKNAAEVVSRALA